MLNNGTKIDAFLYFVIIFFIFFLTSSRGTRRLIFIVRSGAIREQGDSLSIHVPSPFLSRHSNVATHHDLLFQTIDQTVAEWNRLATGTSTVLKRDVIPFRAF